jgi:hypothetical protein
MTWPTYQMKGVPLMKEWLRREIRWMFATRFERQVCDKCRKRFLSTEQGAWTGNRSQEFPELCNCRDRRGRRATNSHTNCRAFGPYCPACAALIEQDILATRQAYGDW